MLTKRTLPLQPITSYTTSKASMAFRRPNKYKRNGRLPNFSNTGYRCLQTPISKYRVPKAAVKNLRVVRTTAYVKAEGINKKNDSLHHQAPSSFGLLHYHVLWNRSN